MTAREVLLEGGPPWGFRMHGGADQGQPLRISRVNPGSRAAAQGVREGDVITAIDGEVTAAMTNADAHQRLRAAGPALRLGLNDSSGGPVRRRGSIRRSSETNNNSSKAANRESEKDSKSEATGGRSGRRRAGAGMSKSRGRSRSDPELAGAGRISSSRARRLRKYRSKMRRAQQQRQEEQEQEQEQDELDDARRTRSAGASRRGSADSGGIGAGGGATPPRGGSVPPDLPAARRGVEISNPAFDDDDEGGGGDGGGDAGWRRSAASLTDSARDSPELDNVEGLESFVIIVTEEHGSGDDGDPDRESAVTIKEIEEIVVDVASMTPKTPLELAAGAHPLERFTVPGRPASPIDTKSVIHAQDTAQFPEATPIHSNFSSTCSLEEENEETDDAQPGGRERHKARTKVKRYPSIVEAYLDHKIKQYELAIQRLDSPPAGDQERPESPVLVERSASVEEVEDDAEGWEFVGELPPAEATPAYFVREFEVDPYCPYEFPTATPGPEQLEAEQCSSGHGCPSAGSSGDSLRSRSSTTSTRGSSRSLEVIEEEPSEEQQQQPRQHQDAVCSARLSRPLRIPLSPSATRRKRAQAYAVEGRAQPLHRTVVKISELAPGERHEVDVGNASDVSCIVAFPPEAAVEGVVKSRPLSGLVDDAEVVFLEDTSSTSSVSSKAPTDEHHDEHDEEEDERESWRPDVPEALVTMPDIVQDASTSPLGRWLQMSADFLHQTAAAAPEAPLAVATPPRLPVPSPLPPPQSGDEPEGGPPSPGGDLDHETISVAAALERSDGEDGPAEDAGGDAGEVADEDAGENAPTGPKAETYHPPAPAPLPACEEQLPDASKEEPATPASPTSGESISERSSVNNGEEECLHSPENNGAVSVAGGSALATPPPPPTPLPQAPSPTPLRKEESATSTSPVVDLNKDEAVCDAPAPLKSCLKISAISINKPFEIVIGHSPEIPPLKPGLVDEAIPEEEETAGAAEVSERFCADGGRSVVSLEMLGGRECVSGGDIRREEASSQPDLSGKTEAQPPFRTMTAADGRAPPGTAHVVDGERDRALEEPLAGGRSAVEARHKFLSDRDVELEMGELIASLQAFGARTEDTRNAREEEDKRQKQVESTATQLRKKNPVARMVEEFFERRGGGKQQPEECRAGVPVEQTTTTSAAKSKGSTVWSLLHRPGPRKRKVPAVASPSGSPAGSPAASPPPTASPAPTQAPPPKTLLRSTVVYASLGEPTPAPGPAPARQLYSEIGPYVREPAHRQQPPRSWTSSPLSRYFSPSPGRSWSTERSCRSASRSPCMSPTRDLSALRRAEAPLTSPSPPCRSDLASPSLSSQSTAVWRPPGLLPDVFETAALFRSSRGASTDRSRVTSPEASDGDRRLADGRLVFLSSPPLAPQPPPWSSSSSWRPGSSVSSSSAWSTGAGSRVLLCLSPSQRQCFRDRAPTPQECAGLLDLHHKFVERRAYHEAPAPPARTHASRSRRQRDQQRQRAVTARWICSQPLGEGSPSPAPRHASSGTLGSARKVRNAEDDEAELLLGLADTLRGRQSPRREQADAPMPTYVLDAGGKHRYEFDSECLTRCVSEARSCIGEAPRTFSSILKDKLFWKLSSLQERGEPPRHTPPRPSPSPARVRRASHGDAGPPAPAASSERTPVGTTPTPVATPTPSDARSEYEDLGPDSPYWQPRAVATPLEQPASAPMSRASSVPHLAHHQDEEQRRQNMYDEYMRQVAERQRRRQQKVIKISDPESVTGPRAKRANVELDLHHHHYHHHPHHDGQQGAPRCEKQHDILSQLQRRAAEKNCVVIKEARDRQHAAVTGVEQLPKHLQEFLAFAREEQEQGEEEGGVWTPGEAAPAAAPRPRGSASPPSAAPRSSPPPPVWTPRSAGASPLVERKAFRPVNFAASPSLSRKAQPPAPGPPPGSVQSPEEPPPWKDAGAPSGPPGPSGSSGLGGSQLPRAPNPTVTLLQKAREGQIPRGAQYLDHESTSSPPLDQCDGDATHVRVVSARRPVDGVGPTTRDGLPTVLRSDEDDESEEEVRDDNKERWYKRMYDQLHKIKQDDDYVTVRYRPSHKDHRISNTRRQEGESTKFTWPGGRTSGYQSEPELGHSDASKYYTLDRRRGPPRQQEYWQQRQQQEQQARQQARQEQRQQERDAVSPALSPPPPSSGSVGVPAAGVPTVTTPRSRAVSESLKYAAEVYRNQPGRIENYEPGKSSIAEREAKQWWDEVLDIFDGMEKRNKENLQAFNKPSFMTYALKESGYESDTQLVVRRREDGPGAEPLSPAQQRTAYKEIQKGGDVPLHGLRKTAPEKPKESPHRYADSEVTIRYRSPVSAALAADAGRPLSEQELSRRQAEAMRRLYQEERRRKYLHELQDISARRHTDNFTPSQKSPIPLNRYDDLLDEYWSAGTGRSSTPVARLAAKALYNFVGQTPRELSFRRGDVILVKRQVDRNWYEGELNGVQGLFPTNYVEVLPYEHLRTTPTKRVQEGQARAKYNFIAQTRMELSLAKGELVNLIRRVDENWFEGRIGNQKGIFPVSYVEVLLEPSERPATTPIPTGKPVAAPAAHSLILNGGGGGPQHSYQPPTSRSPANYSGVTAYGAVPASTISTSSATSGGQQRQAQQQAKQHHDPVHMHQTLHIDTHSDPVPYRALYNYRPQNDDELELLEGDIVLVMEKCDDGWYVGSSQRTGFFGTFPGNYVERI